MSTIVPGTAEAGLAKGPFRAARRRRFPASGGQQEAAVHLVQWRSGVPISC